MSKPVIIKTRHQLGVQAVKQRVTERFETLRRTVKLDKVGDAKLIWEGDTATVSAKALGQRTQGTIAVTEHDLTISFVLPTILAPFRGAIVSFIEKQEDSVKDVPPGG